MFKISHPIPTAAAVTFLVLLAGCDKLMSSGPPPTYESPTVGVAREIGGVQAAPGAAPASAPAASK